jgi:raffinose/stachyose/melibiose transport system permease protein
MKKKIMFFFKYLAIAIVALIIIIPVYDMVLNSFKTEKESRVPSLSMPSKSTFIENYKTAAEKGKVIQGFENSILITLSSTLIILVISVMAAFVFGRRKGKGIRALFLVFLMGIITPPSFIMSLMLLRTLNLSGTYQGIILFYSATFCAFPIFLLSGFMNTIPKEIEESAIMDGATSFQVLIKIILPQLKPAIATSFIWVFLKIWNDFLVPLYLLSGNINKYTMILGLYSFKGKYTTSWNLIFADLILVSIPVVIAYLFAQKQIVEGLGAGALKG